MPASFLFWHYRNIMHPLRLFLAFLFYAVSMQLIVLLLIFIPSFLEKTVLVAEIPCCMALILRSMHITDMHNGCAHHSALYPRIQTSGSSRHRQRIYTSMSENLLQGSVRVKGLMFLNLYNDFLQCPENLNVELVLIPNGLTNP